jgi:polysaccharide export outer membrane protein
MLSEAGGLTHKANEINMQITYGDQISSQVALININNIQSAHDTTTILRNGGTIYIVQNKRKNLQNLSTIIQAVLVFLNTALIIFTLSHR